jgi:hypothetical protein
MEEKCEHLENCGFFLNFQHNTEVVREGWIKLFCNNKKSAEKCQRRRIRNQTGKPPADNMAPTGRIL